MTNSSAILYKLNIFLLGNQNLKVESIILKKENNEIATRCSKPSKQIITYRYLSNKTHYYLLQNNPIMTIYS